MKTSDFLGRWRITSMEMWDKEDFDEAGAAFFEICRGGSGEFRFLLVSVGIDWELAQGPDGKRLEFTWEGVDEMDQCHGSGWVELRSPARIEGRIKFHNGDASMFNAARERSRSR